MKTFVLRALVAFVLVISIASCDSLNNSFAVVGDDWPVKMVIINNGSEIVEIDARSCATGESVKRREASISRGERWEGKFPEGCHDVHIYDYGGYNTAYRFNFHPDTTWVWRPTIR